MRGAQTVGQAPGTSTDSNYSSDAESHADYSEITSWTQWKDLISGTNGTTICSSSGLTAKSQTDLVNYIITAYSEGTRNPMSGNMFEEDAIKEKDKVPNYETLKTIDYNFPESSDKTNATKGVSKDAVIKASHYNAFLNQLATDNGNVVTSSDLPNSDKISNFTQAELGPQIGIQKDNTDSKLSEVSNDHSKDSSIITAQIYIDLANQASKLLYHPFQCNICNVCEGGKFGEIVKELGSAIQKEGWIYSWTKYGDISGPIAGNNGPFNGIRQDCSGFVSACVAIYAMSVGETKSYASCNQTSAQFTDGSFEYNNLFKAAGAGDHANTIYADHNSKSKHVEASDETGMVWSGGGSGNCIGDQAICHEHAVMMNTKSGSSRTKRWVAIGSDGLGHTCDGTQDANCYEDLGNIAEDNKNEDSEGNNSGGNGGSSCTECQTCQSIQFCHIACQTGLCSSEWPEDLPCYYTEADYCDIYHCQIRQDEYCGQCIYTQKK